MKIRHVYSTPDLATARAAVEASIAAGVDRDDLSLVARSDIELDEIPDEYKHDGTDVIPAALRGVGYGSAAGLLAGLVAVVATPIGVTLAGAAAVAAGGAALGGLFASIVGGDVPDAIHRDFDEQIQQGKILLAVDADSSRLAGLETTLVQLGATRLPFDETSALVR